MKLLKKEEWSARAEVHFNRVHAFSQAARKRASRQEKHPVLDFLTLYYPFSLGRFEKWHPGVGVSLESADPERFSEPRYLYDGDGTAQLDRSALTEKERGRYNFTLQLLQKTQSRPALHSCFGLHEWAMVYEGAEVRHRESAPFRLSQAEINAVVESRPLVCTHFDAFRFFSPQAQPKNKHQPTLHDRLSLEQPGCIHTNMDLYKWANKSSPWVGSDLIWECFQLALKARAVDMRASPYDLSEWGYEAIKIETEEGRADYLQHQKKIQEEAEGLRARLISDLKDLLKEGKKGEIPVALS